MSSTFDLSLFFSGTKIECSLNIIYFNRGEWKIIGESRSVFERQKTGSQRDFISPCRDDVTRRNRRRGWIGLEGKFWLKDGRVGHRWDFCQRVSRKIARLVKKLLLEEAASFATYIFRTRPSFSYLSLSLSRHTIRSPRDFLVKTRQTWTKKHENLSLDSSRVFVSPLEEFRAKDAFSLFSRQPRINERGCIFNKSASNYSTNFSRDSDNASSLGSIWKFLSPLK